MVLAHARALLTGVTAPTAYVDADLRDTGEVLAQAARLLDFSQPVAVMLISVLHLIPDQDNPHAIVARLMEAVPSGSWLALSHPARDVHPQQVSEAASRFNQLAPAKATLRTRAEILRFFDGLELLEPGLVQVLRRPGAAGTRPGPGPPVAAWRGRLRAQPGGSWLLRSGPQDLTRQQQRPKQPRRSSGPAVVAVPASHARRPVGHAPSRRWGW